MKYLSDQFTSYDRYLALEAFSEGRSFEAWKLFGAHPDVLNGEIGYHFLLWAPNAKQVCLSGDFNQWNTSSHPMTPLEGGLWEIFIPRLSQYDAYKYAIHSHSGAVTLKTDPYGFHCETRPNTASKLYPMDGYEWNDSAWKTYQDSHNPYNSAMNIYELHLGSWRRGGNGEFLDYRSIASLLVPYVKEMGYTHVELMPVMEHPLDDSWGYQVTGYFAATSRFGTPDDLKYLIDQLHQGGVGVILDWVPAHFPRDAFGLYHFDGTPTYEYEDVRKGEHPQWGTNCFDLGRNEVKSFLFSSAMFWLEEFHADGLRVDAVSSMLYLSFGREDDPGAWTPNVNGGEENLEAISFLQELNTGVFAHFPNALMVAEEATSWPQVTHPVSEGGLGFNFKWNMGWMNDICHYIDLDPLARQHHHKDLTFAMMYAFNENYILPMSHDEVVHEKSSYLGKMAGDTFQKLASSRAFHLYVLTHPGKKLSFMGAEIGQWNEWNFEHSMDWHLMEFDDHKRINYFHKKANELYLDSPSLWERDTTWDGFLWLCADDNLGNTLAYARWDNSGNPLVVICNFSPVHRHGYRLPFPMEGIWEEALSTDWQEFGGANHRNDGDLHTEPVEVYGQAHSREINLPPNATVVFRYSKKNGSVKVSLFDEAIHEQPEEIKNAADFSQDESERWETALQFTAENPVPEADVSFVSEKKAGSDLTIGSAEDAETEAPVKKRGRKKKEDVSEAVEVSESVEEAPKKRGRKKKEESTETVAETAKEVTEVAEIAEEPVKEVKKSGRKKKSELEALAAEAAATVTQIEAVKVEEDDSEAPKKAGRKKKVEEPVALPVNHEEATEEVTPVKKRGRPKKIVDISQANGKPKRGRPKKINPKED